MNKRFSNPLALDEVNRFRIAKKHIKFVAQIPIDVRLTKIESVLRAARASRQEFDRIEGNLSPIICSCFMLMEYIRSRVAEESNRFFLELYRRSSFKKNGWCFYQVDRNKSIEEHLEDKYLDILDPSSKSLVLRLLDDYWDNYIVPILPYIENNLIVFSIKDFEIYIYTLGEIASYRYKESYLDILHIPEFSNIQNGICYIDF
jgi:hypothetical protein